jgi:endonuclease/exonuclease/phosphatase family metal-dependent hydrolase
MLDFFQQDKNDRFFNINQNIYNGKPITIMTWNFSYAYGVGSAGLNYYQKTKYHFIEALDNAVKLIKENKVDIVLLQEIDFFCKKTHFIDQLEYMALKLGFNFAYGTSWKSPYVPFPVLSPEDHFGKTFAGSGVLSRFPIESNKIKLLPKPKENFKVYNLFYPYRYIQKTTIKLGESKLTVGNIHLEAFKIKTRKKQTDILVNYIAKNDIDVFGGDLNTVPLSARKRDKFKDYETDTYVGDDTLSRFYQLNYNELCSEDEYQKSESQWFTFPSNHPDRRLDYIFYRGDLRLQKSEILNSKISDHLPVLAKFKF